MLYHVFPVPSFSRQDEEGLLSVHRLQRFIRIVCGWRGAAGAAPARLDRRLFLRFRSTFISACIGAVIGSGGNGRRQHRRIEAVALTARRGFPFGGFTLGRGLAAVTRIAARPARFRTARPAVFPQERILVRLIQIALRITAATRFVGGIRFRLALAAFLTLFALGGIGAIFADIIAIIALAVVAVLPAIVAALPLFFLALPRIGKDPEIVIRELKIIFFGNPVAIQMRVVCQLPVFLEQLRRISTRTAVDPVQLLTTLLTIVPAATPAVIPTIAAQG